MLKKIIPVLCFILGAVMCILAYPEGIATVLLVVAMSALTIFVIRRFAVEEAEFLTQVFLIALLARITYGTILHIFDLRSFAGDDASTFDLIGNRLVEIWFNLPASGPPVSSRDINNESFWGMNYLVALIYSVFGRNIFAAQSFCGVIGAATAPMVYACAHQMFGNRRIAKISALLVALYPTLIIWSGQLLKDGLIIFLLVLAMTMVLKLQKNFSYLAVTMLIFSLFGIMALRFYIFYMIAAATIGTFVVGLSNSVESIAKRMLALVAIGIGLTYLGVLQNAGNKLDQYANLERVQLSRRSLAEAESGFGADLDVSTTEGALSAVPIGFTYLMFAPFPWEAKNFRQQAVLPETLLWWGLIPFAVGGLLIAVKHRLRASLAILVFTLMLTLAYSIFQGNVGMAYRQRTQIQVFLFIFVAVCWTYIIEYRENEKALNLAKKQQMRKRFQVNT